MLSQPGDRRRLESERKAIDRTDFAVTPVTDEVAAEQQRVADRFPKLGLIPKPDRDPRHRLELDARA